MLPDFTIYQSFRYCLVYQPPSVPIWVDWVIDNWDDVSEEVQSMIKRDTGEAFSPFGCGRAGMMHSPILNMPDWRRLFEI